VRLPRIVTIVVAAVAFCVLPAGSAPAQSQGTAEALGAAGLWTYETLTAAKGQTTRLSGFFLFKDGVFLQEALNDGEPFDQQLVQAHAGSYTVDNAIRLVAEVQLAIRPGRTPAVVSSPGRTHEITPTRDGDRLTLTFGSGTVQTFRRVGPGAGKIVLLDRGALALVDGRFVLVAEAGTRRVVGAGRAESRGSGLQLQAERWITGNGETLRYQRNIRVDATLEGGELRLPGEAPLRVRSGTALAR
jgi:hypothetical protein